MNKSYKRLSALTLLLTILLTSCAAGEFYPLKMDDVYYLDADTGALVKFSSENGYTDKEIALIRDEKLTYPETTRKYVTVPCGTDFSSTGAVNVNIAYSVVDGKIVLATPAEIEAPFEYIGIPGDTSRIFIWVGNTGINLLNLSEDTAQPISADAAPYMRPLEYIEGKGLLYQAGDSVQASSLYLYNADGSSSKLIAPFNGREYIKTARDGGLICASLEYNNGVGYYRTVDSLNLDSGEFTQLYRSTGKGEIFSFTGTNMIYSTPGNGILELTDYTAGTSELYDIGAYAEVSYALLSPDGKYLAVLKDLPDANGYIYVSLITMNLQTGEVKEHYSSAEADGYSLYYTEWYDDSHLIINYLSDSAAKSGYSMIKTVNH